MRQPSIRNVDNARCVVAACLLVVAGTRYLGTCSDGVSGDGGLAPRRDTTAAVVESGGPGMVEEPPAAGPELPPPQPLLVPEPEPQAQQAAVASEPSAFSAVSGGGQDLAGLRALFDEFDADGGGTINAYELRAAMKKHGVEVSPKEADELIAAADDDGGGDLDFDEFALFMASASDRDAMNNRRGTPIEGLAGVARTVSVTAEMHAASSRLTAANASSDASEMQAAIGALAPHTCRILGVLALNAVTPRADAALALARRAEGTSATREMTKLAEACKRRLATDGALRESNELRQSAQVHAKIQRLWDLMVVESMAILYDDMMAAEDAALATRLAGRGGPLDDEPAGNRRSRFSSPDGRSSKKPQQKVRAEVTQEGYCSLHVRLNKVLSAPAENEEEADATASAHRDWAADIKRFTGGSHITAWLQEMRDSFKRASEKAIAAAGFRALFQRYDADGSGELDRGEFEQAVRTDLQIDEATVPQVELGRLFSAVDVDRSGAMDATEFVSWLFAKPRPGQGSIALVKRLFIQASADVSEELGWKSLFDEYDDDGSGELELSEFVEAVRVSCGLTEKAVPHEDIRELFNVIDVDQSGAIDATELRAFLHEELSAGSMNFSAFHSATFELGSLWVPEPLNEERLVNFLQAVFEWVCVPVTKQAKDALSAAGFGAGGALAAVPVFSERKYDGTSLDKWGKDVLTQTEQAAGLLAVLDADVGGVRKVLPNFRVRPLDTIGSMIGPDGELSIVLDESTVDAAGKEAEEGAGGTKFSALTESEKEGLSRHVTFSEDDEQDEVEEQQLEADEAAQGGRVRDMGAVWRCPQCSYDDNPLTQDQCAICEAARPLPPSPENTWGDNEGDDARRLAALADELPAETPEEKLARLQKARQAAEAELERVNADKAAFDEAEARRLAKREAKEHKAEQSAAIRGVVAGTREEQESWRHRVAAQLLALQEEEIALQKRLAAGLTEEEAVAVRDRLQITSEANAAMQAQKVAATANETKKRSPRGRSPPTQRTAVETMQPAAAPAADSEAQARRAAALAGVPYLGPLNALGRSSGAGADNVVIPSVPSSHPAAKVAFSDDDNTTMGVTNVRGSEPEPPVFAAALDPTPRKQTNFLRRGQATRPGSAGARLQSSSRYKPHLQVHLVSAQRSAEHIVGGIVGGVSAWGETYEGGVWTSGEPFARSYTDLSPDKTKRVHYGRGELPQQHVAAEQAGGEEGVGLSDINDGGSGSSSSNSGGGVSGASSIHGCWSMERQQRQQHLDPAITVAISDSATTDDQNASSGSGLMAARRTGGHARREVARHGGGGYGGRQRAARVDVGAWADYNEARESLAKMGIAVSDQQFQGLRQSWERSSGTMLRASPTNARVRRSREQQLAETGDGSPGASSGGQQLLRPSSAQAIASAAWGGDDVSYAGGSPNGSWDGWRDDLDEYRAGAQSSESEVVPARPASAPPKRSQESIAMAAAGAELDAQPSFLSAAVTNVANNPPALIRGNGERNSNQSTRNESKGGSPKLVSFSSPTLGMVSPSFPVRALASTEALGWADTSRRRRRGQRGKKNRRTKQRPALPAPQLPTGGVGGLLSTSRIELQAPSMRDFELDPSLIGLGSSAAFKLKAQERRSEREKLRVRRPATAPSQRGARGQKVVRIMPRAVIP